MTASEALQLGIVDQVTERDAVDAAVKFALSVSGEPLGGASTSTHSHLGFKKFTGSGRGGRR